MCIWYCFNPSHQIFSEFLKKETDPNNISIWCPYYTYTHQKYVHRICKALWQKSPGNLSRFILFKALADIKELYITKEQARHRPYLSMCWFMAHFLYPGLGRVTGKAKISCDENNLNKGCLFVIKTLSQVLILIFVNMCLWFCVQS